MWSIKVMMATTFMSLTGKFHPALQLTFKKCVVYNLSRHCDWVRSQAQSALIFRWVCLTTEPALHQSPVRSLPVRTHYPLQLKHSGSQKWQGLLEVTPDPQPGFLSPTCVHAHGSGQHRLTPHAIREGISMQSSPSHRLPHWEPPPGLVACFTLSRPFCWSFCPIQHGKSRKECQWRKKKGNSWQILNE